MYIYSSWNQLNVINDTIHSTTPLISTPVNFSLVSLQGCVERNIIRTIFSLQGAASGASIPVVDSVSELFLIAMIIVSK